MVNIPLAATKAHPKGRKTILSLRPLSTRQLCSFIAVTIWHPSKVSQYIPDNRVINTLQERPEHSDSMGSGTWNGISHEAQTEQTVTSSTVTAGGEWHHSFSSTSTLVVHFRSVLSAGSTCYQWRSVIQHLVPTILHGKMEIKLPSTKLPLNQSTTLATGNRNPTIPSPHISPTHPTSSLNIFSCCKVAPLKILESHW